ncbi:hypothetical protein KJ641_01405 [Patescibacteria group bacterium]|nr:hypothetical protein [Patescibacteria group bacterium]MBU1895508.1 hypothetical protein [Patescibacteria group bacterium]
MHLKQFNIITERLDKIETLLKNIQPKPKKPRQTKITETRNLENQMRPFESLYAKSVLREFWLYWSQKSVSGKERWQLEKVFDVPKRLETWKRKEEKWQWEKEQREVLKKTDEKPDRKTHAKKEWKKD